MSRMFKYVFYIFIILVTLCLGFTMISGVSLKHAFSPSKIVNFSKGSLVIKTVNGDAHGFTVEIANTPASRTQGLMDRKTLADNAGMLLLFDDTKTIGLWMKNTYIPLDMLFIDKAGVIIEVVENTKPLSTEPIIAHYPAASVLEINAGLTKKLNITIGDTVVYKLKK